MKSTKLNWRVVGSIAVIALVLAGAGIATRAYFSDTEKTTGNTFTAGAIDLKVDNSSYYNGELNPVSSWTLADLDDGRGPSGDGKYLFFSFADVKPADWGEDTISLHVNNNDAWICADVTLTNNDENDLVSAETRMQDTDGKGELAEEINFVWWADDGDNVLETNETVIQQANLGAAPMNIPVPVILADSTKNIWNAQGGPVPGTATRYIGKAWCYGAMQLAPVQPGDNSPLGPVANSGILCDGKNVSNLSQTDSAKLDVVFNAAQARHNDTFTCPKLRYPLTVTKAGTGTGSVTSDVAGIACGDDCTEDIYRTTVVTLTAAPDVSSNFTGWTGACTGTGTCTVTMDEAKNVEAGFGIKTFTLTVNKTGNGDGTITSIPGGISYPGDVTETYRYGTEVSLSAIAAGSSNWNGWSGDCVGTGACIITMDQDRSVTGTFSLKTFTLNVSKSGLGSGTVTSSPAGINCGGDCSEIYNYGTSVTLTANPSSGILFGGWSGNCTGNTTCTVTMDGVKNVTAAFWRAFNATNTFSASQDTYFDWNAPDTSHGSLSEMLVYMITGTGGHATYAFVKFDVSSIPTNSTVNSADLKLYAHSLPSVGNAFTPALVVTSAWTESLAGWAQVPVTTGADMAMTTVNSVGWKTWGVQSAVQKMVSGTITNYGWEISTGPGTQINFRTREYTNSTLRPQLQINYTYFQ